MFKVQSPESAPVLIGLIAATLIIFTNFSIFSFVFFLYVIAGQLKAFSVSKGGALIWAYLGVSTGTIVLYSLSWLAGISIRPVVTLLLIALVAWCLEIFNPSLGSKTAESRAYPLLSLGISVFICIFVSLPILRHPSGANVLRYAAKTGDDINHMAIIEADRDLSGFLYTSSQKSSTYVNTDMNTYPQGWHINGAFFESQLLKLLKADNAKARLLSYYIYKTLWLGIAVFMVCELMFSVSERLFGILSKYLILLVALSGLFVSGFFLLSLFGYGFQSFIATIAFLCAGLMIMINYLNQKKYRNFYILALSAAGMASSSIWILTAPTLQIPALFLLIRDSRSRWRSNQIANLLVVIGSIAMMILSLLPLYVQFHFRHGSVGSVVNDSGAVPPIRWISVAICWGLWFWLIAKLPRRESNQLIGIAILIFLEFFLFALDQELRFGTQHYYSVKITLSSAIIGLSLLLPLLLTRVLSLKTYLAIRATASLFLLLSIPLLFGLDVRKSAYPLKDSAPISIPAANIVLARSGKGNNLVIVSKDPGDSYLATKTAADVWVFGSQQEKQSIEYLSRAVNSPADWNSLKHTRVFDGNINTIRL